MKNISPKQLAIYIAILTCILISLSTSIIVFSHNQFNWLVFATTIVATYFIIYSATLRLMKKLIIDRINPIYKTITNANLPQKNLKKLFENNVIFSEVKTDVIDWAQKRKNEIADLKKTEEYRKEFLGNVMHELKTPIFNIQGYVLTLLDGGLEDKSVNRPYLERTEKSINRLISIVEDLESISRLEAGELTLEKSDFDLKKIIEESFDIHEMMARKMNINLNFESISEKPLFVEADKNRILEVINNLVVNSIKYGKKNGKTTVSLHDMHENILVEVSDNGIGIEKEKIPRLFERFYRVDKGRSREQGGTGLGLSIVKHIIEAHDQTVNVNSSLNKGTSFTFTIKKANTKVVKAK